MVDVIVEARVDDHDVPGFPYAVRWYGGHGLHLVTREGEDLAYRTVGDQSKNALTIEEAETEVQEWADWINSGDPAALEFY